MGIKSGATLMLIGTPEGEELKMPDQLTPFVEDLSPSEKATLYYQKTGTSLPIGLKNLGYTCYINSTVQCLKRVFELKEALKEEDLGRS